MKRWQVQFAVIVAMVASPIAAALAINYNSGTYGSCQYNSCSITINSSGSVALNVTPSGSGSCTIQSDNVSVLTDDSNGFSLTLADLTTNTSLVKGAASIPATTGTFASPIALTADKWGYRLDNAGGFGAGPTTAQTSVPISAATFAGVKASNVTADTIKTTAVPANPAVNTLVWYGVCADNSLTPGSYTTTVTYTAITN